MKQLLYLFVLVSAALLAFRNPKEKLFTIPKKWPKPLYDFSQNKLSEAKIKLGRALFYDPLLSADNTISCASCHSPYNAFTHVDHDLSHGINDRIGTRNSPALMNLAWKSSFMWDGAIANLDMQSLAPISHPDEMGSSIEKVVSELNRSALYRKAFYQAYGDSLITGEKTLKALSQFMLSLVSSDSKYDRVMLKQEQFTEQEARGYSLFRQNCAACHREPLFTNDAFANNGLPVDPSLNDCGKMKISKKSADSLLFKVPTLRNLEYSFPYMHDGRFKKLSQVINHYVSGIQHSKTLAPELQKPIILSSNEKVDLLAFLLTLSDKNFVFNPDFAYPKDFFTPAAKD
ncbi:MAG: Cytochrome-c peroxidase [Crocinitomicaceae bacterium]|jgi:cytochrome c peroxidase|nr:Cytochrome-c peroxidase [Crocinitomicaceae bacterium]